MWQKKRRRKALFLTEQERRETRIEMIGLSLLSGEWMSYVEMNRLLKNSVPASLMMIWNQALTSRMQRERARYDAKRAARPSPGP